MFDSEGVWYGADHLPSPSSGVLQAPPERRLWDRLDPEHPDALPPGPELAAVLAGLDVDALPDHAQVDVIGAYERLSSWAAAGQAVAIAAIAGRRDADPGVSTSQASRHTEDEISLALRVSRLAAAQRLALADGLAHRPGTAAALAAGRLDVPKARAIVEATDDLDPELGAAVEAAVLERASRQTTGALKAALARARIAVDPGAAERRHRAARRGRRVEFGPERDGITGVYAPLPADDAAHLEATLRWRARHTKTPADARSADNRRADALVELVGLGAATLDPSRTPHPPSTDPASHHDNDHDDDHDNDHDNDGDGNDGDHRDQDPGSDDRGGSDPGGSDPGWSDPESSTDPPAYGEHPAADHCDDRDDPDDRDDRDDHHDHRDDHHDHRDRRADRGGTRADRGGGRRNGRRGRRNNHPDQPTGDRRRWNRRAEVQVLVAATTLAGLDDQPGELAGHGPIPAALARALARDATWRRILTDPAGRPIEVGRTRYRPPAALDDLVRARDKRCRFPTCRQPAHQDDRVDLDHTVPHPDGPTAAVNLACLCRRHHRLKQHPRWRVMHDPDGTLWWITPTGHIYRSDPDDD